MKEQEWISELVNGFTRLTELTHEQATRYVNATGHEYWRRHYLAGAEPEDVIRQEILDWDLPETEGG